MHTEQIIELVKQHEVLYNVKCDDYRDASHRNAAWDNIATQSGKTAEECKEHWTKIRNAYNNAMKRRIKKIRVGKTISPWRYEEQMSFLRPNLPGLKLDISDNDYVSDDDTCASTSSPERKQSKDNSHTSTINNLSADDDPLVKVKRCESLEGDSYTMCDMMDIMKNPHETHQRAQGLDETDYFFISMSKSLKKLPKLDQMRIKMDLHKAINDAELKQLEVQQNKRHMLRN